MFCSSLLAQPGSNYGSTRYRVVPGTAAHAERTRTCWSTEYYDYCRFLLPAPYIGFACFSLQVLLYSYLPLQQHQLPLQQQQLSVFFMLYTPQLLRRLICTTVHVGTAVRQLVLLCEKKLPVRHLFLAPSLRAPVSTAAVYVPVLTYADLRSSLSKRYYSYWVLPCLCTGRILRTGAGVGTFCCQVSLIGH